MKKIIQQVKPGIYQVVFGEPNSSCVDLFNISSSIELENTPDIACPFRVEDFFVKKTKRGLVIEMQPQEKERFYGLGLMLKSFCHNGTRKRLRTNADPIKDTGDSHAPVPFLISTANYGILVDSLRGVTFEVMNSATKRNRIEESVKKYTVATDTDTLYQKNSESHYLPGCYLPDCNCSCSYDCKRNHGSLQLQLCKLGIHGYLLVDRCRRCA